MYRRRVFVTHNTSQLAYRLVNAKQNISNPLARSASWSTALNRICPMVIQQYPMLLYMSSSVNEYLVGLLDGRVKCQAGSA